MAGVPRGGRQLTQIEIRYSPAEKKEEGKKRMRGMWDRFSLRREVTCQKVWQPRTATVYAGTAADTRWEAIHVLPSRARPYRSAPNSAWSTG